METFILKFNNITGELLNDLKGAYPELANSIENFQLGDREYFNYFAINILPHAQMIIDKNPELLDKVEIMPNVDLTFIMKTAGHENNREILWKYLGTLAYLVNCAFEEAQKNIATAETPEDIVSQMKQAGFNEEFFAEQSKAFLKFLDTNAKGSKEDGTPGVSPEMEKIADSLFGGMIGNLAKEIATEINPSELNIDPNNPQALLENLFSPNNNNLMNLVQNISGKLQSRLESGQLDQQALFNEASQIMNNLQTAMPNMGAGGGTGMFPGMDPSMMAGLMSGLMGASNPKKSGNRSKNLKLLPKNHPKRRGEGK